MNTFLELARKNAKSGPQFLIVLRMLEIEAMELAAPVLIA